MNQYRQTPNMDRLETGTQYLQRRYHKSTPRRQKLKLIQETPRLLTNGPAERTQSPRGNQETPRRRRYLLRKTHPPIPIRINIEVQITE